MTGYATSKTPRVLFFADAGAQVGGGHVMRCLTLAGALMARGAACGFVVTPAVSRLLYAFAEAGIERIEIAEGDLPALVARAAQAATAWGAQIVVVDHYGVSAAQERALRPVGGRLLVIDDLKRTHDADWVLDSNIGRAAGDYPGLGVMAGPSFTLVRPAFAALREASLARRAAATEARRVLVAMGLTDVGAITGRVVGAILPHLGAREMDVVLGAGSPSLSQIQALAKTDARVRLHVDSRDMAALTAAADLAIGAGGSSTWERCCLGVPTVTVVLADNQRDSALVLEALGASVALEAGAADFAARLAAVFVELAGDRARLKALSGACSQICDGSGAERVARLLLESSGF